MPNSIYLFSKLLLLFTSKATCASHTHTPTQFKLIFLLSYSKPATMGLFIHPFFEEKQFFSCFFFYCRKQFSNNTSVCVPVIIFLAKRQRQKQKEKLLTRTIHKKLN